MNLLPARDLVLGITPFEEPNAQLAVAIERAGGVGVLGLGHDASAARSALADAARWLRGRSTFGVRVPAGCPLGPHELPADVDTVVLGSGSPWSPTDADLVGRRVLVEVTSLAQARTVAAGAAGRRPHGLIAKGSESGGPVGETTAFVLLQQLLADPAVDLPVWCAGGIGLHTAAAAVAGGATGVVLDAQLALVREAALPTAVQSAIRAMDGSETTVIGGHRVYTRPDLPVAALHTGEEVGTAVEGSDGGAVGGNGASAPARSATTAATALPAETLATTPPTTPAGRKSEPRSNFGPTGPLFDRGSTFRPATAAATPAETVRPAQVAARLGARDLRTQLLPIGQDGAFARPLADAYPTAGAVVAAVRQSITDHIVTSRAVQPLAPHGRFAASRGLGVSVAQGPMTRVSDRAAFALAVAEAGGLPFLALALMGTDEVRVLLEETAERLQGRTWGVGILGFVPAELREQQLSVIHDVRPPCALIAGGRPSQAAPLEAVGIDTFLHVPSPGLLDRFLRDGARKFVFEGRECGGHVGPRSSFALWESQIERLLAFGHADEVHVLFAGGIHDERSAAMVGALAAPLAQRGGAVGVLMGTAYLFTDEAVATGAIVSGFQQAAVTCETTVLLETSPGHATRCVDTEYVQAFRAAKRRLEADGASQQQVWAELEQLNLGRLRLASKGVRRQDRQLVAVGEDEQRREGMVMIGDVATLRSATTTVAALHRQVSDGATEFLDNRAQELGLPEEQAGWSGQAVPAEQADPLDIAIVGMAGIFPAAGDTDQYWANVVAGVDAVTEVSPERWDVGTYYDSAAVTTGAGQKTPSKWGGFLPDVPFDALSYGVPPASLSAIDPTQLLALEVAARALADAGYQDRRFARERTAVVFGAESSTDLSGAYGFRALHQSYVGPLPETLDGYLPSLTEDSFPGMLANVIAGRIANRLDLGGSNYTVDAACASSLAALDVACKELRAGTSDLVLCGGADVHNGLQDFLLFSSVHALSPTGRCRTFDAKADGIALGEGVACLVLKRLADAERDGDRVYAVVKAIAGSSDGRSLGLTAPRPEGQRRALERAYRMAGVSPAQVGLMEAHGTGTVVGDRTELATLTELFTDAGAAPGRCALGSVKSQIGHTKCAAGLAGIIKVARALHRGVRPPTGQLTEPNGYWDRDQSPFFFDTAARPWAAPAGERFAGVSAFGFGGTNFHAVLGAYDGGPEPEQGLDEWPAELFVFRGADRAAAGAQIEHLARLMAANDAAGRPWRLRDLAFTVAGSAGPTLAGTAGPTLAGTAGPTLAGTAAAAAARGSATVQVALVASDLDDLAAKLPSARAFTAAPGVFVADPGRADPGQVAFLFPGQGSQTPGMLADLFVAFPRLRHHLAPLGDLAAVLFPSAAFTREERDRQRAAITDTRVAQPVLGVAGLAMHELLATVGVRPDLAGGHSYGELVALAAAGALEQEDLVAISAVRGAAILAAAGDDPGAMAAVTATADAVRAALRETGTDGVVVANHNAPNQVVISGPTAAVDTAVERLAISGLAAQKIPVACAFHSALVAGAATTLRIELAARNVSAPAIPVWSNTTARPYPAEPDAVRDTLAGQVAAPVRFVDQVEAMYQAGARVFVEAGPGRVLTTLVGRILGDRPHVAVACDVAGEPGVARFLTALAQLAAAGVPVDTEALWRGRQVRTVSLADVPRRPGWVVSGHLVRTADGAPLPGGLQPMTTVPRTPAAAPGGRDAAVFEFLRTSRELVAAQRDVLLGYLGTGGGENAAAWTAIPAVPSTPVPARAEALIAASTDTTVSPVPAPTPSGPLTRTQILDAVLAIVSTRTGYPSDMLDPDLDLEADLSIDSIKRTEILGELAERVGLTGGDHASLDESTVEELARRKTLNAIVDWIVAHVAPDMANNDTPDADAPATSTVPADAPPVEAPLPASELTVRQVVDLEKLASLPAARYDTAVLAGRRYVIVDGGLGIGLELSELLEQRGAEVVILDTEQATGNPGALDGAHALVHLAGVDPDQPPMLPDAFVVLREAAERRLAQLLVVTGAGGRFGFGRTNAAEAGLGVGGLLRTMRTEYPQMTCQLVDVDPKERAGAIASALLAELTAAEPAALVGYSRGARSTRRITTVELQPARETPARDIETAAGALGLGRDSVVLLTGGARGITSKVAMELARVTGCHIELMGRTQAPESDENPTTAGATNAAAIRRALIESGTRVPSQVEVATARILASREIRATLAQLERSASSARYHVADVRHGDAVGAVVDGIYARHGRLDGVIHGAGVLEDKRMSDKGVESFERVFGTKVDGARNLASALRPDLGFFVLFGSVAGVFGNKGQVDYAAANDALDSLARTWTQRFRGRVVAVDWGPWAGAGMVSAELEREYARRGVGLITVEDGVSCLLRELAFGPQSDSQVIYLRHPAPER